MPVNKKFKARFEPGDTLHVYNRTNNKERLFRKSRDRSYFLLLFQKIVLPFIDPFAWTLIPNHFHFVVRTKEKNEIKEYLSNLLEEHLTITEIKFLEGKIDVAELVLMEFRRMMQAYTAVYNKMYGRKGNLFHRSLKRVKIKSDRQFRKAIIYVHKNAEKHKIVDDFRDFEWSSWHELSGNTRIFLNRNEVYEKFGNKKGFIHAHELG